MRSGTCWSFIFDIVISFLFIPELLNSAVLLKISVGVLLSLSDNQKLLKIFFLWNDLEQTFEVGIGPIALKTHISKTVVFLSRNLFTAFWFEKVNL